MLYMISLTQKHPYITKVENDIYDDLDDEEILSLARHRKGKVKPRFLSDIDAEKVPMDRLKLMVENRIFFVSSATMEKIDRYDKRIADRIRKRSSFEAFDYAKNFKKENSN